ncbi:MAG: gamma-glutamyltransferase family protein, partial [Myxococcales bacterium]|nr:gamma-glutamyltransferase family protein [Myxococcales bacterium]
AGSLASFVAEPLLSSAGGSGMMMVAMPGHEPAVVDFFSEVPGHGGRPETLDFDPVNIDFGSARQVFHVGRGSVAVPLAFPGFALAQQTYGRLPLSDLVQPAERMARIGVPCTKEMALTFEVLWSIVSRDPETQAVLAPQGRPPSPGSIQINPALAALFLEFGRIGRTPEVLRRGLLEDFGPARGGLITEADLRATAPRILAPRRLQMGKFEVLGSPRIGGRLVGIIVEALARSPRLSDSAEEMLRIAKASLEGHRARTHNEHGSTTHISVMDADGGAAAATLTNGEGCGHMAPGTGVQLNNFLGEEDLNPTGFHKQAPGSALQSMIAPTIALDRGEPVLAVGSGGANRIRSTVAQVLYRVVFLGQSLDEAVGAPRLHAEDAEVWVELEGLAEPERIVALLDAHFPKVCAFEDRAFFFGGAHSVLRRDGKLTGVGDIRRGGAVVRV